MTVPDEFRIAGADVSAYTIPTERPEADGTLAWDSTTMVVVEPRTVAGTRGLGYVFGDTATATLARDVLVPLVQDADVRGHAATWERMVRRIRNLGRPGIASMAISALDIALWDIHARVLGTPLYQLLGPLRDRVPAYGSGGFTTYDDDTLREQLTGWTAQGLRWVKMKIGESWGTCEARDLHRIGVARAAIGDGVGLFVDANGGYTRKQARRLGERFAAEHGVSWFEEPVSSDDLAGLRLLRDSLTLDVTAGEYGYDLVYFERMLDAGAVDVLQADIGRCGGVTEWLRAAAVCAAHGLRFSGHCGPSIHLHAACAAPTLEHLEYFHDHVRIDHMCFDGVVEPRNGTLAPAPDRPGIGLELRRGDVERYRVM